MQPLSNMHFVHPWQRNDWIQLEMARRIAARLQDDPSLIERALKWILGLRKVGRDYVAHREWEDILKKSSRDDVVRLLTKDDDEGQRLRSSHPFQGVIPETERREIIANAFAS